MDVFISQFSHSSLIWAFFIVLLIAGFFAIRAIIGYKSVARDAASDYDYKASEGMVDKRLTKDGYVRAYMRFNAPRAQALIAATLFMCAILTLPALGFLNYLYYKLWEVGGRDEAFTPGFLVHALSMFFMIIMFWATIAYYVARHYHTRTPISFKDEMLREID